MTERKRTRIVVIPLVCFALVCLLTSHPAAQEKPKFGETLIVGMPVDPFSLNPIVTTSLHTAYVTGQIYNRLVRVDWSGKLLPELAESWDISKDGLTYTFHLVKNAVWHDGKPFTSADVKYGIEAIQKYHPAGQSNFGAVDRVETPDTHTAVVRMKQPFPPFMDVLYATRLASIIPKHIYEGTDVMTNPHNAADPVGTGPWMLKEWVKGSHVTLVRNPNYFKKDQPYLDRLIFKIFADPSTQLTAFEAGEVDYLPWNLPPHEALRLQKDPKYIVKSFGMGFMLSHAIGFNTERPFLKDVRVRRAIAHAIDKEYLLKTTDFGFGKIKHSVISDEAITAWCYNPDIQKYPFDMKKAEQLLDEAGHPRKADGMRFELSVINTFADPTVVKNSEIIRDWLKKIGIGLKIETMDTATGFDRVFRRWDFDLFYYMLSTGPDPHVGLRRLYHSDNIRHHAGVVNATGYRNPRVDELFDLAAKTLDREERGRYYREFQKIVLEDLPYFPIYEAYAIQVFRKEFKELPVGFDAAMEAMDGVWSDKGKDKR